MNKAIDILKRNWLYLAGAVIGESEVIYTGII